MFVCPYRVDGATSGAKVYDIDPVVIFLSGEVREPGPTGVALYHRYYLRGTAEQRISEFGNCDRPTTVSGLRTQILTGIGPISGVPQPIRDTLTNMVNDFQTLLSG